MTPRGLAVSVTSCFPAVLEVGRSRRAAVAGGVVIRNVHRSALWVSPWGDGVAGRLYVGAVSGAVASTAARCAVICEVLAVEGLAADVAGVSS